MKRLLLSTVFLTLLLSPTLILAEESDPDTAITPSNKIQTTREEKAPNLKEALEKKRGAVKEALEKRAETAKELTGKRRELIKGQKEASKEAWLEKKEDRVEAWKEKQETIKEAIEQKREAIKKTQEIKKQQLKEKLEKFKDKRQAEAVSKVDKNLNLINEKQTKAMSSYLEKLGNIMEKLEERIALAKSNGKDTAKAEEALQQAKISFASAGETVANQAGKDYTLTINDETKVKAEAKNMRDKLHNDLQTTRKSVVDAKQAVSSAIKTAAQTLGGDNEE